MQTMRVETKLGLGDVYNRENNTFKILNEVRFYFCSIYTSCSCRKMSNLQLVQHLDVHWLMKCWSWFHLDQSSKNIWYRMVDLLQNTSSDEICSRDDLTLSGPLWYFDLFAFCKSTLRTVQYCTVLYHTVLYNTVLNCTKLYCTVHRTVLYCAIKYWTRPIHTSCRSESSYLYLCLVV